MPSSKGDTGVCANNAAATKTTPKNIKTNFLITCLIYIDTKIILQPPSNLGIVFWRPPIFQITKAYLKGLKILIFSLETH